MDVLLLEGDAVKTRKPYWRSIYLDKAEQKIPDFLSERFENVNADRRILFIFLLLHWNHSEWVIILFQLTEQTDKNKHLFDTFLIFQKIKK